MKAIVRDTRQAWTDRFDAFLNGCLRVVSSKLDKELARHAAERGAGGLRWITPDEAVAAGALANLMVPSDEGSPGIEDVGVLGPSFLEVLDRLIANSPWRQGLYGRGLLAFDVLAKQECGCAFASMAEADQIRLLTAAQHFYEEWASPGPPLQKGWRRLRMAFRGRGMPFSVSQLYPQIRSDCLEVFYTSRVSWMWLQYDGPPMDKGYPHLAPQSLQGVP